MKIDKDMNVKNINSFYAALKNEIENNNQVVLDFSDTVRIDSAVAQLILSAAKKTRDLNKSMNFTGVSSQLLKLLKLAGIKLQ